MYKCINLFIRRNPIYFMNILIAPNSFRGTLDTFQVANIIEKAFMEVSSNFEITKLPIADGSKFTDEVLLRNLGGRWKTVRVLNPLGQEIEAQLGITLDNVAIIELSKASGINLIEKNNLNPSITTTYGTGQLIKAALEEGCKKIIIALGNSATTDGGVGLLQALGVQFLDKEGKEIGFGGAELQRIETIDESGLDSRIADTEIIVPCHIHNYLLGKKGAAIMFAPKKGADPAMVEMLEEAMTHYSLKIWELFRRDTVNLKYGGVAGGTAAGLWAFLNARLVLGSRYILTALDFDTAAKKADLIITAEGKIDNQTIHGKAPFEVAIRAKRFKKTIIAIAGQVPTSDIELFHAVFSIINKPMPINTALQNTERLLYGTSFQIAKLYKQLTKPKPKPKTIEKLMVINADIFEHTTDALEKTAFVFAALKKAEIPFLFYSKRTYEEMLWMSELLTVHQPFVIENGSAFYVPKEYLKLDLEGFSTKGNFNELTFGGTKDTIENITYKLAKVTGLASLKNDIETPLDLADYLDIEIIDAERIMTRRFSQMIVKTEETPELNDMFRMLIQQQGLQIIETNEAYFIGHFDNVKPIQNWVDFLKSKYPDLQTIIVSDEAGDRDIFELGDEAYLLKKGAEWQPLLIDNLNLINGSGISGFNQVVEFITKKNK